MYDPLATVISQYASSPRLCGLVVAWNACIDPAADIDAFFDDVWNIETAIGYGLDVLGRIVGVARTANTIVLSDTVYRNVILAKAMANTCNASNNAINQILIRLFGSASPTPIVGNSFVLDGSNDVPMTMQLVFGPPAELVGASIAATTMAVPSDPLNGNLVLVGQEVQGAGVAAGTMVLAQLTGVHGLAGNYQVSISQTVGAESLTTHSLLTDEQLAIVNYSGVIPKPAGVSLTVVS